MYARLAPCEDARGTAEHRSQLLAEARGRVVEVGAGTGLNFRHYPGAVTEVLATEPDPHMFKRLATALDTASVPVRLHRATADSIPVDDGWADAVVFSLVLCSVPDVAAALDEATRVLRPDGRVFFYEHVRSRDLRFATWQDRFERLWGVFGGGCHPNRDTVRAIEVAGFRIERLDRFDVAGNLLATPHVLGSAVR
jgi:ubiquinone/menaquinone biosynthesis C-methylase UbiE